MQWEIELDYIDSLKQKHFHIFIIIGSVYFKYIILILYYCPNRNSC